MNNNNGFYEMTRVTRETSEYDISHPQPPPLYPFPPMEEDEDEEEEIFVESPPNVPLHPEYQIVVTLMDIAGSTTAGAAEAAMDIVVETGETSGEIDEIHGDDNGTECMDVDECD